MTEELKRLAKTSAIYLLGNIANRLGAFLLLPLYTHRLTVQQYGLLELLYSTIAMISVMVSLGLSHATLRFYFEFKEKIDRDAVITTNLIVMSALCAGVMSVLYYWRTALAGLILDDPLFASTLTICFAIIVLELTAEILMAYLRAKEYAFLFVGLSVLRLVVQVAGSLFFLVVLDDGVPGVLKANLISIAVGWAVAFVIVVKECGYAFHRKKVFPILKYSLPFALGGIIGVAGGNVDRFILKALVSMEAVGIYGLAAKFASLLSFLLAEPFYRSYGPFRFSIMQKPNAALIQGQVAHYLIIGVTFLALGIALYTPDVIRIMATEEYLGAAIFAPILLFGAGFSVLNYCFQTGILYSKETRHIFNISTGAAIFSALSCYVCIRTFGAVGAAISCALTQVLIAFWTNLKSQSYFKVEYPIHRMVRIVLLGVGAYIPAAFFPIENILLSLLVKFILLCLFFFSAYFSDIEVRSLLNKAFAQLSAIRVR